jgi:hypothetical protein
MLPEPPPQLEWLDPWQRLEGSYDGFVRELQKEVPPLHVLHGLSVVAVARRIDCDDVLFVTANPAMPLAVVHLTWTGRTESDPRWPHTTSYKSWEDWTERCLLTDHHEYCGGDR